MSTRLDSHRTIAEAYHRALEFGFADVEEVISWVDAVILADDRPALAFFDASSAGGDPAALLSSLREVPGVADANGRRRLIFGMMQRALERDPDTIQPIARALYSMAQAGDVPDPEAERLMWWFDDALELAAQGYGGDHEAIRRDLVQLLCRHAGATE